MAIILYQPGEDHVVDEVKCNVITCELHEMPALLEEGWYKVPGEWEPKKKTKKKEEVEAGAD